jgi:transposase
MARSPINLPINEHACGRGEVLVVPERRRWSPEEKARIVEESLMPGAVAGVVARRYGVHPNLLYGWRRQLRPAAGTPAAVPDFVPVRVAVASEPSIRAPQADPPDRPIEIVLGGATVRVPPSADAATLRRVLTVIRRL